jgi:hypothetical protein
MLCYSIYALYPWRKLENNELSSLHKLLRNRLVGGGSSTPPHPLHPRHTHSLAGSVTINAKTTVHCSPGSSMPVSKKLHLEKYKKYHHNRLYMNTLPANERLQLNLFFLPYFYISIFYSFHSNTNPLLRASPH